MSHFWEVVDVAKEKLGPSVSSSSQHEPLTPTGRKTHKVKATSSTVPIMASPSLALPVRPSSTRARPASRPKSVHLEQADNNGCDEVFENADSKAQQDGGTGTR